MKRKFFSVLFALVLVLSMSMIMAPPALAATEVTDVWVDFPMEEAPNKMSTAGNPYIIHFKATTALVRGVDYVTVNFPDGTTAMGPAAFTAITGTVASSEVTFSTNYGTTVVGDATWTATTSVTTGGYRVKALLPFNYAAGTDIWVKIDSDAVTAAGTEAATYKVYVSTTKDTARVLSSVFALGDTVTTEAAMHTNYPIPSTAGATPDYIFSFKPAATLTEASDKVTVKFPVGTTLPSSIAATNISFGASASCDSSTTEIPTVNANTREVTAVIPIGMDGGTTYYMKIAAAAGIINPTIADASYYILIRNSDDGRYDRSGTWDITAGSANQVLVANGEIGTPGSQYSDDATMINMYSSKIWVTLADQYGNAKYPGSTVTVTPSSSSTTGSFHTKSSLTVGSGDFSSVDTITISQIDPNVYTQVVYYKDTSAGSYTLTFAADEYTNTEWSFTVCSGVSVYDASDSLVKTYAPTSTSPVAEQDADDDPGTGDTQKYSCDYITDAISGALAGDTVKLGDGIYELDGTINLNKKITLTSVNGASSTTIRPTVEPLTHTLTGYDVAILVQITGTAANPVVIDGLTVTRLRLDTEFAMAVFNNGFDYVTVRNCVFDYIIPEHAQYSDSPYGSVVSFLSYDAIAYSGDQLITSGTISNNTFTNCCTFGFNQYGEQHNSISVMAKDEADNKTISGVTISGNTLTDCNGIGIWLKGYYITHATVTASVTDNTLTNVVYPISVGGYTDSISILRNTVTGGYMAGLWVEFSDHNSLVIKNNTFTGCAGTGASSMDYSCVILLYDDGSDDTTGAGSLLINTVQYNDFSNNDATYSIYAVPSIVGAQDCQYNYYGDASGPAYTALTGAVVGKSNPNGTGKKVSDEVTYYPWLHKPLADVVADNASYQACTMKLVSGWNTLSTPVQLIEAADSIDELIPSGMTIAYAYDGGWKQINTANYPTGYTLSPCDAVYAKMSAATDVLLKFDAGAFTAPSKDLAAGWNLISLAYLDSAGKTDLATVASVAKTAANLPGYSQLVSPSLNATQTNMFGVAGTSWAFAYGGGTVSSCYAGLGYWVYMQNAATLAGFEITPIAPDLD